LCCDARALHRRVQLAREAVALVLSPPDLRLELLVAILEQALEIECRRDRVARGCLEEALHLAREPRQADRIGLSHGATGSLAHKNPRGIAG
jgi:hypothetical protein